MAVVDWEISRNYGSILDNHVQGRSDPDKRNLKDDITYFVEKNWNRFMEKRAKAMQIKFSHEHDSNRTISADNLKDLDDTTADLTIWKACHPIAKMYWDTVERESFKNGTDESITELDDFTKYHKHLYNHMQDRFYETERFYLTEPSRTMWVILNGLLYTTEGIMHSGTVTRNVEETNKILVRLVI